MRLNLWDFGGQDIYHGSHAHFIDSRAIFLLLWTPATETGEYVDGHGLNMLHHPLSYWLDYVRTLAGDACPLFVVQSQCDEREVETPPLLPSSAQATPPKCLAISAKTDRGLDTLRGVLRDATRDLFVREGVTPVGGGRQRLRMKLRDLVEQESLLPVPQRMHRTIDRETFAAWCDEVGGISSVDAMLNFLHSTGVVFHRPGMFQDRIILDQNWAFEAIYALFRRDNLFPRLARDGRFRLADLDQVWESYAPAERELFLDVMLECGICFRGRRLTENTWEHAAYEFIAPELLPEWHQVRRERLRRLENSAPTVQATARFEFLHHGVLRRLLSKIGDRVGPDGIFGRFGCQFYDATTQVEVRIDAEFDNDPEHPHAGRIVFNGWGPRAFELLEPLLEVLEQVCLGQQPQVERSWNEPRVSLPHTEEPLHAVRPAPAPAAVLKVYLSYAWGNNQPGDETGQRRLRVANQIIEQVPGWGYELRHDKQKMRPGDRISEFMHEISHGDHRVIVVLSDKYLKSIYCMTELMEIYDYSRRDEQVFLRRVRPVVLPDAKIGTTLDRAEYVDYWQEQVQKYEARIEKPGGYKSLGVYGKDELDAMNRWIIDLADRLKSISDLIAPHVQLRELDESMLEALRTLLERDTLA